MRTVPNTGTDRVLDLVRPWRQTDNRIDFASRTLSLSILWRVCRKSGAHGRGAHFIQPPDNAKLYLPASAAGQAARNRLRGHWLAGRRAAWIEKTADAWRPPYALSRLGPLRTGAYPADAHSRRGAMGAGLVGSANALRRGRRPSWRGLVMPSIACQTGVRHAPMMKMPHA